VTWFIASKPSDGGSAGARDVLGAAVKAESAGLLMYRRRNQRLELLLVHPGGPFFKNKDTGAWSLPKGEVAPDEPLLEAAQREFYEETGVTARGPFIELGSIQQTGRKVVHAFAFEGDCDPLATCSNTFSLEWPPRSGRFQDFPEVDRAEFFDSETALVKINPAQRDFILALQARLER
jgi:predicted NUDIX family NTP pyrophosphohydrolase